jgi:hypothetical protein
MSRSKLFLPFLKILFFKPRLILKSLFHVTTNETTQNHVKMLGFSDGLPVIDLLELIPNLNVEISNYSFLNGTSFTIDIAVLKSLASSFKDCSYLEIGSWRGESIANVADVAKECTSISLSDEEIRKMGFSEKFTRVSRFFSKEKNNIHYIAHNSMTFDFSSLKKKFDMIFVDGDHAYEAVKSDTANAFKLLKDENSIIVWHDYARALEFVNYPVLAGILDGTPEEKRKNIYSISNTLCAIYSTKKFQTGKLDHPTYPNKKFDVAMKAISIEK